MNLYEVVRFGYTPFHDIYLGNTVFREISKLIWNVAWMYVVSRYLSRYIEEGVLIRSFVGGLNVFAIITTLILILFFPALVVLYLKETRLTLLFADNIIVGPNALGRTLLLSFYLNLLCFSYADKIKIKIYYVFFCIFNVIAIVLTLSRGTIVALLFGVAYLIYSNKKILRLSFFFLLFLGMLCQISTKDFFNFLPRRLTVNQMMKEKTSGRSDIWSDYFHYAKLKDYLVGVGYNATAESILYQKPLRSIYSLKSRNHAIATETRRLRIWHIHNIYFYILFVYGVSGIFIYFFFLCLFYNNIKRNLSLSLAIRRIYLSLYVSIIVTLTSEVVGDLMFYPVLISCFSIKSIANVKKDETA
jgi:O-antigen ligase